MEKNSGDKGRREADSRPAKNSNQQKKAPAGLRQQPKSKLWNHLGKTNIVVSLLAGFVTIVGVGIQITQAYVENWHQTLVQERDKGYDTQDRKNSQIDSLKTALIEKDRRIEALEDSAKARRHHSSDANEYAPQESGSVGGTAWKDLPVNFEVIPEEPRNDHIAPYESPSMNNPGFKWRAPDPTPDFRTKNRHLQREKDLSERRTQQWVRKILQKHSPAVQKLYQIMLKHNLRREGELVVRFTLDVNGRLTAPEIVESNLDWLEFEQSMLIKMKGWNDFGVDEIHGRPFTYRVKYVFGN